MKSDSSKVGISPVLNYKDRLFYMQPRSEKPVVVYQTRGDSLIFNGELLRKGDGPVDMNIPVLKIDPLTDSLYALGLYNRENKIFRCSLSENDLPDEETWERTLWRGNFNIKDACPIGNGQFMTTGSAQDSDKMIFLFNPKKESFVPLDCPFPDDKVGEPISKSIIYSGRIEKHPDKNRFVYYARTYGRYFFIFEYENGVFKKIATPLDILPDYELTSGVSKRKVAPECLSGIREIYVTSRYLYVEYSPYSLEEIREMVDESDDWRYSNRIYVFDWDGNPVKCYHTDQPIDIFTVTTDDRYLYATGIPAEGEDITLRFNLYSSSH